MPINLYEAPKAGLSDEKGRGGGCLRYGLIILVTAVVSSWATFILLMWGLR